MLLNNPIIIAVSYINDCIFIIQMCYVQTFLCIGTITKMEKRNIKIHTCASFNCFREKWFSTLDANYICVCTSIRKAFTVHGSSVYFFKFCFRSIPSLYLRSFLYIVQKTLIYHIYIRDMCGYLVFDVPPFAR